MNRKAFDLVICSALAAVAMTLTLLAPESGLARALVALPLVLFAPGYAIVAVAFPANRLRTIERLLFSLGASLAVAALAGLLLHWTALGLRPAAWAVALGNLTLVSSLIALLRPRRQPASAPVQRGTGLTLSQGGLLGLAALLVAGAVVIARDGAIQQRATGFTQLWVLPDSAAKADSVRLGVSNREPGQIGYRLLVTASGTIIGSWPRITLGPDEQWEATVALPTAQPAVVTVEAVLYRLDAPETVYRRVLLHRDSQAKSN
jgi:Protein of unknown function (DUF1616)